MGRSILFIIFSLGYFYAEAQKLPLNTNSDSAVYYYYQGWEQVLDYGHFSNSEKAYRAMYRHDPELLTGAALLARITTDPKERKDLIDEIRAVADRVSGDERRLLDLFVNLGQLYILRETGAEQELAKHLEKTFTKGENTLRLLAHKYPDDVYYKAEYIEVLHYNHGPEKAIDSLNALFSDPTPFMLGYRAQMTAELKNFDSAFTDAKELEKMMADKQAPYVFMVYATIHKEMGNTDEALNYVNLALQIDPGHILAKRLLNELSEG